MANRRTRSGSERLTKAERREQARLERIQIQRKMARARRTRWIALGVAVVVGAGVAVFAVTRPKPAVISPTGLLTQASAQASAAGCSEVRTIGAYQDQPNGLDRAHIGSAGGPTTMPPLSTYPSVPPTSGPHNPTPLNAGVYQRPPPIDQTIHSLEHGAAIVWYAPDAPADTIARIDRFYRQGSVGSRIIVAPYDYPEQGQAGSLPGGAQMALVAWHRLEMCARPNLAAAFGFTARYAFPNFDYRQDFTATASTDTFTSRTQVFSDGDAVSVQGGGSLPDGVVVGTLYYVVDRKGDTFQLSRIPDGKPVELDTDGDGALKLQYLGEAPEPGAAI